MNFRVISTYQQQAVRFKVPAQTPKRFLRVNQDRTQGKLWMNPESIRYAHPAWFAHQVDAEDAFIDIVEVAGGVSGQLKLFTTRTVNQLMPAQKNRVIEGLVKQLQDELTRIQRPRADKLMLAGSLIGWRDGLYGMHATIAEYPWLTTRDGYTHTLSPEIAVDLMVDRLIDGFGYKNPFQDVHDKFMVGFFDNVLPTELAIRYALNSIANNKVSQEVISRRLSELNQFLESSPGPTEFMNGVKYLLQAEYKRFRDMGIPKGKSYKATQFWTSKNFSYQRGWFLGTVLGIALGILEVSESCDLETSLQVLLTGKRCSTIISNAAEAHNDSFFPLVMESLFSDNDIWTLMDQAIQTLERNRQHSDARRLREFKKIIVEHSIKQQSTLNFVLMYLNEIIDGTADKLPQKLW